MSTYGINLYENIKNELTRWMVRLLSSFYSWSLRTSDSFVIKQLFRLQESGFKWTFLFRQSSLWHLLQIWRCTIKSCNGASQTQRKGYTIFERAGRLRFHLRQRCNLSWNACSSRSWRACSQYKLKPQLAPVWPHQFGYGTHPIW